MLKATKKETKSRLPDIKGKVKWRSPSNIALIKYWGKKGYQIPANPSLSFTLDNCHTETELQFQPKQSEAKKIALKFFFQGKENAAFGQRTEKYLNSLLEELPFLAELELEVHTRNSFPHSAGIASSASGMSALALCLCSLEEKLNGKPKDKAAFFERASNLARLGSGSAARSVYGGVVVWGKSGQIAGSSNERAVPFPGMVHDTFRNFKDTILIVSRKTKQVSSRQGHALMEGHPFADKRYEQAQHNLTKLATVLVEGDEARFCQIVENEAFSLHGLMMTSDPPVILFEPATWEIINKVRNFREESGLPICITLDAGPNVHLLYPHRVKKDMEQFINRELIVYCDRKGLIHDNIGKGPTKLTA